jgi:thiol-disulfide isomerase/thioredoxin
MLIGFYVFRKMIKQEKIKDTNTILTADIYYFYTSWCPYCVKARPEWDKFKTFWEHKKKNGYNLIFSELIVIKMNLCNQI